MENKDWNHIYTQLSPNLLGICRRYIPDIYAAEDILQDSFMTAIQKGHQLKNEKLLFAWLKKIVINNALLYLRKSSRETSIDTETSEIPEISLAMNENMEEKTSVLAYDFTSEELLSSIDSLPSHHKSVFNLYLIENYSHAEIAGILGISVNTSKSHLLRAKKFVKNYLIDHVIKPDTPKNKRKITQLLIFMGLGGLVWAQTFKNTFSDFLVQPSRSLEIPENTIQQDISSLSNSMANWKIKVLTGIGIFAVIVSSIIIFKPGNQEIPGKHIQAERKVIVQEKEKTGNKNSDLTTFNKSTHYPADKRMTTTTPSEKVNVQKENSKITLKHQKNIIKDSSEKTIKKIIVVKKIIQRDTIYVER